MVKMRRRDFAAPAPKEPEVIRLEKIVEKDATDLSPLEAQLRKQSAEIAELRELIKKMPKSKDRKPENYRFVVKRGPNQLIESVDGIVVSDRDDPTLLELGSGSLH